MSRLSEDEIIKYIKDEIENETDTFHWFDNIPENKTRKQVEESINAHQGLLDLYNKEKMNSFSLSEQLDKEKEKNKKLEKYKKYYETEKVVWSRKDYISKDKIKEELNELDNMKVDGKVFTTAVNFAKKILQELLEERN